MVLSKREGLLLGPGLAWSFCFSCSFGCCISCCLGPFSGAILVAIWWLDKGWILAWSFGCLFSVAVLVGPFLALLVVVLVFAFV